MFECYSTLSRVQMRMNPSDPYYELLSETLEEATTANDEKSLGRAHGKLTSVGQKILKVEWERLKVEMSFDAASMKL